MCGWCGAEVNIPARGRIPKWCSGTCRHRAWEQARAAASSALSVLGARAGEVRAVMRLDMSAAQPRLERLEVSFQDSSGAIVSKNPDGSYAAAPVAASLDMVVTRLAGEIDAESFYSSAVAAGVPEQEAWRVAFGLVVGLIFLYLNILRLLSYLQSD